MIIGGFSAYSGVVDWAKMREIADSIGAYLFVDMAHVAGWLLLAYTRTRFLMLTLLLPPLTKPRRVRAAA